MENIIEIAFIVTAVIVVFYLKSLYQHPYPFCVELREKNRLFYSWINRNFNK